MALEIVRRKEEKEKLKPSHATYFWHKGLCLVRAVFDQMIGALVRI